MINEYFPLRGGKLPWLTQEESDWMMIDWIVDSNPSHWVWGYDIASIVKDKRKWKSGDLKNGWQSILLNGHKLKYQAHLYEPITDDWEGMTIGWNGSTFVFRK